MQKLSIRNLPLLKIQPVERHSWLKLVWPRTMCELAGGSHLYVEWSVRPPTQSVLTATGTPRPAAGVAAETAGVETFAGDIEGAEVVIRSRSTANPLLGPLLAIHLVRSKVETVSTACLICMTPSGGWHFKDNLHKHRLLATTWGGGLLEADFELVV